MNASCCSDLSKHFGQAQDIQQGSVQQEFNSSEDDCSIYYISFTSLLSSSDYVVLTKSRNAKIRKIWILKMP